MKYSLTLKVSTDYGDHVVVEVFAGQIPSSMEHFDAARNHNGTLTMPANDFVLFVRRVKPHLLSVKHFPPELENMYSPTEHGYYKLDKDVEW